ncbi:unnamed protein product [Brachionus calyciflorus]|uniref:TLC domain-containing protein n=1 Tax=Brachionus calyciflorus TaxID=104777 RepID=A0A813TQD9_9BILA|nr:unnamed protein product [Brachionus calyciflorus]
MQLTSTLMPELLANMDMSNQTQNMSVYDYLSQLSYRNLIVISLILMFSIIFYLIFLIVDSLIDKQRHYNLSLKSFERYEQAVLRRRQNEPSKIRDENQEQEERTRKLQYTIWTNRNLQVSFIHSCLCSLWLIYILIFKHTELFSDLLFSVSWDTYLLLAFSCGYFLYDFYDICANGYLKKEWVICLHHWIVLLSFGYHMINLISIGYTIIALLMEFNSVFLHARKLLKFYGFKKNSLVVNLNCFMNILSFMTCRFGVLGIIAYGVKIDGHRVTTQYLCMLITFVGIMAIINVILFKRIAEKDLVPLCFGRRSKKSHQQETNKFDINEDEDVNNIEKLQHVNMSQNLVLLVQKN